MPKKSAVSLTIAAAALLAAGTSPALARNTDTRSFQSLPSVKTNATLRTSNLFAPKASITPVSKSPSSFFQPPQSSFGGNRFGGGLATLFGFLPPRVQDAIANALGNAGPGGQRLCRLLGIPQCGNPDSTG